ncbi:lipocalin family protein [Bacteroidota bacterium]
MKIKLLIIITLGFLGCKSNTNSLETVDSIDIQKYQGLWYEIAIVPNNFEKGCSCTTAEYIPNEKGYIDVINTCKRKGKIDKIKGKAFVVKNSNNTKLKVQFFWPFKGNYWIIDIDENYTYAVVSGPSRKYLWILSRKPEMDKELYNSILKDLAEKNFDITKIVKTIHDCNQ